MLPTYATASATANGTEAEHLHHLVNQLPFMIWASDRDGFCTFFNETWLNFRGRTIAQETGSGWMEGVHPDDRQRCLDAYQHAFDSREPFRIEYRLLRADGQYCWIRGTGRPQNTLDGRFNGYIGAFIEVPSPAPPATVPPLTARETQVLQLVADGKSTKEIAVLLHISYKTADSHRSRIMEKLDIHETASLVRYAVRQGVVPA